MRRGIPVDTYTFETNFADAKQGVSGRYEVSYRFAAASWRDGGVTGDRPLQQVQLTGMHQSADQPGAVKVQLPVLRACDSTSNIQESCVGLITASEVIDIARS